MAIVSISVIVWFISPYFPRHYAIPSRQPHLGDYYWPKPASLIYERRTIGAKGVEWLDNIFYRSGVSDLLSNFN